MIDDDFDRLFDRMIRKLFGSIDAFSDSNSIIRFGLDLLGKDSLEIDVAEQKKPQPEQIDLGDSLLIILNVGVLEDEPIVEINSGYLVIHWGPSEEKELRFPLSTRGLLIAENATPNLFGVAFRC